MQSPFVQPRPAPGMSKTSVALVSLGVGLVIGFVAGLGATKAGAAFLEDFATSEAAADVAHPRSHDRPAFSFRYPGNWKVTGDEPDHRVNVESPGSCLTIFIVFDTPIAPATSLRTHTEAVVPKLLSSPARTSFTKWGKFEGEGVALKGKILGLNEGTIRLFAFANEARSFVVMEQCYDEDMKDVKPGFDLLESSFELKSPCADGGACPP